jgi:hypothetical protein
MFYCFAGQTGGDQIALVAHVKACKSNEAAAFLNSTSASTASVQNRSLARTRPQFPRQTQATGKASIPRLTSPGLIPSTRLSLSSTSLGKLSWSKSRFVGHERRGHRIRRSWSRRRSRSPSGDPYIVVTPSVVFCVRLPSLSYKSVAVE